MKEALPCSSLIIKTHEWNQNVRNHRVANTPRHLGQEKSNLQHVATLTEVSKRISAGELLITTSNYIIVEYVRIHFCASCLDVLAVILVPPP